MSLLEPTTAVVLDRPGALVADGQLATVLPPPVEVAAAGLDMIRTWRGVPGATGAQVTSSTLVVAPERQGTRDVGVVASARSQQTSATVVSPAPGARVRGLRIPDLVRHDGEDAFPITGQADLGQFRLVVTPIVGGAELAPVVAVPPIPRKKALPAQLVGGALQGSFLALPDVAGDRFLVTLVQGDAPEDFERMTFSHGDIRMYTPPGPVGLHVDGPDGAELHALAGPLVATARVDVTAAVQRHLDAAIGADDVIATLTVRSDVVGRAAVAWTISGHIERAIADRLTVDIEGFPVVVPLPAPVPPRPPLRTRATVTISHHGAAVHPISAAVPVDDGGRGGPVVRDRAVVRALPPEALRGHHITQVGVIGWVLADADLTVGVLGRTASLTGLAAPAGRSAPTVVWLPLDEPVAVDGPVRVSLTASRGAFGWIADPDPLVRFAVATPPEGMVVTVGGQPIQLVGEETVVVDRTLVGVGALAPGAPSAGPPASIPGWAVQTDQFCTVSLAKVAMEFSP